MNPRSVLPRLAVGAIIAGAALWLALNRDRLDPALLESWIADLGMWAPIVHIVLFAIGTILFVPGAIFGLAGGLLFGPLWGTLFNLAGATLGATAAFLVARYLAADWVRRKSGARLQTLIAGVEAEGWRFVAFTRLVPLFPFNLLNYALGLTRIPLTHYVLASLICMTPGTVALTWLAYAGREALAGHDAAIRHALIGLALLASIAFLPSFVRRLRAGSLARPGRTQPTDEISWIEPGALVDRLARGPAPAIIDVRGADEFIGPLSHIPEAQNVPIAELQARLGALGALKDRPIVLVCKTDRRSTAASALLHGAGFGDVHVLRGGMERWNKERRSGRD
jgi:uncharacterized membrane protein YdjX (TVP38/TMEM64 family)/rhodanese-related sulfurtransferase